MQPQPLQRIVSPSARPEGANTLSLVFEKTLACHGRFNEAKVRDEITSRIKSLGSEFYGDYTVLVGDVPGIAVTAGFGWKAHDPRQRGIGFIIGETTDGTVLYPPRCFSLRPPAHVDIEELWQSLDGRRVAVRPKLTPVPTAAKPKLEPVVLVSNPLEKALLKQRHHAERLRLASIEQEALMAEIASLEEEIAKMPLIATIVNERLVAVGLPPVADSHPAPNT